MMNDCVYKEECPKYGDTLLCVDVCQYYMLVNSYLKVRQVPPYYSNLTKADIFTGIQFNAVSDYINSFEEVCQEGIGLYIYSTPTKDNPFGTGTGKTSSACIILNEFVKWACKQSLQGKLELTTHPALFVSMSEFQNIYNKQFRQANQTSYYPLKELMKKALLLVLDDIAVRNLSDAFMNEVFEIFNHRHNHFLMNIFTSNISLNKLTDFYNDRIVSRLYSMTTEVNIKGTDRRKRMIDIVE